MQVEAAQHEISDCDPRKGKATLSLLTLDAVKCFDKISQEGVLREARSFGLPDEVVRSLAAFYRSITRVITYAGHVDIWGFHPTVGIPQGCALSAFLCNVLVSGWADKVAAHATPEAYLDDRTMYARTPGELHAAWVCSQEWDLQHGWTLNQAKTALAMTHPDDEVQFTFDDGQPLAKQDCILKLGHQIPFSFRHALELQVKRWKAALRSCERLEVMRVSTVAAQRVIATVVMRQFAFGFQAIPIPVRQCKSLRAAVKRAAHVAGRRHSWAALSALILKPEVGDCLQVLRQEGITSRESAHAYNAAVNAATRRCGTLKKHAAAAQAKQWHASSSSHPSMRARCHLCRLTGYFEVQPRWLTSHCPIPVGARRDSGLVEVMRDIESDELTYHQHHELMVKILRVC